MNSLKNVEGVKGQTFWLARYNKSKNKEFRCESVALGCGPKQLEGDLVEEVDTCPLHYDSNPVLLHRPAVPTSCVLSPPWRSKVDSWYSKAEELPYKDHCLRARDHCLRARGHCLRARCHCLCTRGHCLCLLLARLCWVLALWGRAFNRQPRNPPPPFILVTLTTV